MSVLFVLAACKSGGVGQHPGDGVESIEATDGTATSPSQADLTVDLAVPGHVAAVCADRDDPDDAHLVEADGDTTATLRFAGLLPGTRYDCVVATTDPVGVPAHAGFKTLDAPPGLATATATYGAEDMTGAYTVMNVKPECGAEKDDNYITVLDPDGNNRFSYELPIGMGPGVEVNADGPDRFLWGGGDDGIIGAPQVVDLHDGPQWTLDASSYSGVTFHHETRRLSDGRVLVAEKTITDDGWQAFQLRIVDDTGATQWYWDVRDAVAAGWLSPGSVDDPDPHHLNWADVVDSGNGPIAYGSLCYAEELVAIDVTSGAPLWKFGKGGDFTLVDKDGNPLPDTEFPQCQHGLETDGTHFLVYDNGWERGYTRAVEYTLDTATMTATEDWVWADDAPFYERIHGGTDWLTDDHQRVLVAEADSACDATERRSQIVEVDRGNGDAVVHRLVMDDVQDWIYRAHRIDGCAMFANAKYCPAIADRIEELRPILGD